MSDRSAAPTSRASLRNILAASAGHLLEWYDFSVYAWFAIPIGANFSPTNIKIPASSMPFWYSVWGS